MGAITSQITSLTIVYPKVYSGADQHWPLCGNSPVTGEFPHKWPVTRKLFPFNDVIMFHSVYQRAPTLEQMFPHINTNFLWGTTKIIFTLSFPNAEVVETLSHDGNTLITRPGLNLKRLIAFLLHFYLVKFVKSFTKKQQGCQIKTGQGGWFNIKMSSYQYRKSHCGDKTILRPSYLHNGISYTGKMASLYWIRAQ